MLFATFGPELEKFYATKLRPFFLVRKFVVLSNANRAGFWWIMRKYGVLYNLEEGKVVVLSKDLLVDASRVHMDKKIQEIQFVNVKGEGLILVINGQSPSKESRSFVSCCI